MTLKVRILRCLRRLFINLVSLTMTWFSEKMLVSTRCIHGFMSNLIKKSWTDSIECAPNCKTRPLLKKITITNIWHSTPISTFDALSKWHEPDISTQFWNWILDPVSNIKKQLNHFNGGVIVALAFILWVRPLKIEEAPLKVPDLVQRELLPLYTDYGHPTKA